MNAELISAAMLIFVGSANTSSLWEADFVSHIVTYHVLGCFPDCKDARMLLLVASTDAILDRAATGRFGM